MAIQFANVSKTTCPAFNAHVVARALYTIDRLEWSCMPEDKLDAALLRHSFPRDEALYETQAIMAHASN